MNSYLKLASFFVFLMIPVFALGQGSGTTRQPSGIPTNNSSRNFAVNKSIKGVLVSAKAGVVTIETKKKKEFSAQITRETVFFIDKKKIALKDLKEGQIKVGQRVRLRYISPGNSKIAYVQSLRVLKKKKKKEIKL